MQNETAKENQFIYDRAVYFPLAFNERLHLSHFQQLDENK
jgi:hypothetical protein